jgi:hypothetical protein
MRFTVGQKAHVWNGPEPVPGHVHWEDKVRARPAQQAWPLPSVRMGLTCYAVSTLLVFLGVAMGHGLLPKPPHSDRFYSYLVNWDGGWYLGIVQRGYFSDPQGQTSAAFFPAYPVLGWMAAQATGVRPEVALVIVSHVCFAGALILLAAYVRLRFAAGPEHLPGFVLFAVALFPTAFFFRMAYSESLFLFLAILAFYLMERKAAPWLVAVVIGLATASRVPGICLLVPFAWHIWRNSHDNRDGARRLVVLVPLAGWGIIAYVGYCWHHFGQPLAFITAQNMWHARTASWGDKLYCLATFEPLASVFEPSCPGYWKIRVTYQNPWFSLAAANPFYFVFAVVLVGVGVYRRWLTAKEWTFAGALLFVTYVSRGYDMCMLSSGRFVAVVFPIYLVLGQLLCRCPPPLAAAVLAVSAVFLTIYAALFAAAHFLI